MQLWFLWLYLSEINGESINTKGLMGGVRLFLAYCLGY